MSSVYPPDGGPDPFVYNGTQSQAVAEVVVGRFIAGDSLADLIDDYPSDDVERILRWWICRRIARVRT